MPIEYEPQEEFPRRRARAHTPRRNHALRLAVVHGEPRHFANLHAPLANFDPAGLHPREFDYNSENAYRLIESKLKQLGYYSRIEFATWPAVEFREPEIARRNYANERVTIGRRFMCRPNEFGQRPWLFRDPREISLNRKAKLFLSRCRVIAFLIPLRRLMCTGTV